jgi:hypothetical protein
VHCVLCTALLTHAEHCASHCPVEMANIFKTPRLSLLLDIRLNVSPLDRENKVHVTII